MGWVMVGDGGGLWGEGRWGAVGWVMVGDCGVRG